MGRSVYPPPGTAKPVQRGVILMVAATSATATISSANVAKSELSNLGTSNTSSTGENADVVLTNATTITATRGSSGGTQRVSWELKESY